MTLRRSAPLDVRVTVEVPEETPCDSVEVRLHGLESHDFYRQFKHSCVERDVLVDEIRAFPTELLAKGTHHYDVRFELPETLPASFRNDHSEVSYESNGFLCELRHGFVGKPNTRLIVNSVTAAGRSVTFRPSDIEALASLGAICDSPGASVTASFGTFVEDPATFEHVIESVSRVVRNAGSADAGPYR